MDEAIARAEIVRAGRRLGARGLVAAAEGNLSIRLDGARLLVTPTGRRKDELIAEDLVVVAIDADGPVRDTAAGGTALTPTSDLAIHRAVLRGRPDIEAVVHAHLPVAMALTLGGETPDPAVLPETAALLTRLPLVPLAPMGSPELAAAIAAAFVGGPEPLPRAVLLERHGAVAVGASVDDAVNALELVDVLCRTWRDALLIRSARSRDGVE